MIDPQEPPPAQEEAAEAMRRALEALRSRPGATGRLGIGALLWAAFRRRFFRLPRVRLRARHLRRLGIGLLVVVLSVASCSAGVDTEALTARWGPPVPATTDAARRLMERTARSIQAAAASRSISLTVSEAEATSVLSLGLMMPDLMRAAERIPRSEMEGITDLGELRARIQQELRAATPKAEGLPGTGRRIARALDPGLHAGDVQVRFEENGHMVVAGYLQAWRFRQPALFVLAPRASSGRLELDFVEGKLGRAPLPESLFDLLGSTVASTVLMGQEYAEVSRLSVGDGTLHIEGRLR